MCANGHLLALPLHRLSPSDVRVLKLHEDTRVGWESFSDSDNDSYADCSGDDTSCTSSDGEQATLDDSIKQLMRERFFLSMSCSMCHRIPNKRCVHRNNPRCFQHCDRAECEVHGEQVKKRTEDNRHAVTQQQSSEVVGDLPVAKGHILLAKLPKCPPPVARWKAWDEHVDTKVNILQKALNSREMQAT